MKHGSKSMVIGWRSMLLTLAAAILAGLAAATGPLDRIIEIGIGHLAWRPVSGDIVVVGIDEQTLNTVQNESGMMPLHANLVRRIGETGAKRLLLDFNYSGRTNDPHFEQLTNAVVELGERAVIAVPVSSYIENEAIAEQWPSKKFGALAERACICWEYKYWQVWDIPTAVKVDGIVIPSFASIMADIPLSVPSRSSIDFSYRTSTIPYYSAMDILNSKVSAIELQDKDVILAGVAVSFADRHYLPGHDLVPGAFIHVVAAETLKRGIPKELGWIPSFLTISALLIGLILFHKTSRFLIIALISALILISAKIIAANFLVNLMVGPSLLLIAIFSFLIARARNQQNAQHRNAVSGLPNFSAMRALPAFDEQIVIAAQIINFDELVTYLPPESSTDLVQQVARRLEIATIGSQLHHDTDGSFAWLSCLNIEDELEAQLAGLAALFNAPISIDGRRIDVKIAFGVNDESTGSNAQRLAAARSAAERAVRSRNLVEKHIENDHDASWSLSFRSQLEDALAAGDIWVAYQPQFDINSGKMIGVEALARWTHPERGIIPPDQFIVQAEKSKDIHRLTLFVMERAIQSGAELRNAGHELTISVNLSAGLLDRTDLASTVHLMLLAHHLPPEKLTIEITETAQFENSPQAMLTLSQLRQYGVKLSIDDYGTGQSNLEYLTRIETDEIKIDKRFVITMCESQRNFEIVKSTIDLAHRLGAVAVAEGIETQHTLNLLQKLGCDVGQGYHLGKPQLFFEILAMLSDSNQSRSA